MCSLSPLLDLVWQFATRFFTPICNFFVSFLSAASDWFHNIKIVNTARIPHQRCILPSRETNIFVRLNSKKLSKKIRVYRLSTNGKRPGVQGWEKTWVQVHRCGHGVGSVLIFFDLYFTAKKQNKTLKLVSKLVNSFIFECVILILLTADGKTLFKFLAKENRSLHAAQPVNSSCRKHTESISAVKIFAYKLNQALVTGKKIFGKIVRFRSFTEI